MSKRKPAWDNYKEKVAKKRMRKGEEKAATGPKGGLTVQRLSANVEGKCQKYSRIGPLILVPCDKELTLENIKAVCKAHFNTELECDVLAGERGPSYTESGQIQNWKVLHVRFVEVLEHPTKEKSGRNIANKKPSFHSEPATGSPQKSHSQYPHSKSVSVRPSPSVARSMSLSQMLKLGKVIVPDIDVVTLRLEEFCILRMEWLEPFEVSLSMEKKPFANGAFRAAYLAKSIAGLPKGKYVIKKYLEEEKKAIEALFGSVELHTRKSVQLNALARNFAQSMASEVQASEFGETFVYGKVYYSSLNGEPVTLETHLAGVFEKFVNNTGELCVEYADANELSLKAETFVHYTFQKSNQQLIVTDIQGVNFSLCDPEIATAELEDPEDKAIRFCSGNLSDAAIKTFFQCHKCNRYCEMLKLSKQQ
ncbi:alpha-protein kinase 1-like [Dendronephthya gigantea]|uniref:alpha-protein kinase 1-like n=1 Tax=Dendronephthya gigantea TaxID=151771 RepID=UPI00106C6F3F|nr:alpha-protein kinase 1-like [Dendronephthya gigantea]